MVDDGKEGHEVDIFTNNTEDHDENYDRDRHEHVDTSAGMREAVPMISFNTEVKQDLNRFNVHLNFLSESLFDLKQKSFALLHKRLL